MIFSDLKPGTTNWDKNEVEVCFTAKGILRDFKDEVNSTAFLEGRDPLYIDTHDEDPNNMYIIIKLDTPYDVKIVQKAMERECKKLDCEILDY